MVQYCDPGAVDFQPGASGAQQPSKSDPILLNCVGSLFQDGVWPADCFRGVFTLDEPSKNSYRLTY